MRLWDARRLAAENARMRGNTGDDELYLSYFIPRDPATYSDSQNNFLEHPTPCLPEETTAGQTPHESLGARGKEERLQRLLTTYYDDLERGHMGAMAFESVPPGVPRGFARLGELYASLAELHPFVEANSRTRLLVLQTELVRLGGHPLMLEELGWGLYYYNTPAALQARLLTGWCAWEAARANGTSPYPAGFDYEYQGHDTCCVVKEDGTSTRHFLPGCMPVEHSSAYYDPKVGTCVSVPMSEAAQGRLALGATRAPRGHLYKR